MISNSTLITLLISNHLLLLHHARWRWTLLCVAESESPLPIYKNIAKEIGATGAIPLDHLAARDSGNGKSDGMETEIAGRECERM
jgi:hypothetical protein